MSTFRSRVSMLKTQRESQRAAASVLQRAANIQDRAGDLTSRAAKLRLAVEAAQAAGIDLTSIKEVTQFRDDIAQLQSTWESDPEAEQLGTCEKQAKALEEHLSSLARDAWISARTASCNETLIGLLAACIDLGVDGAAQLLAAASGLRYAPAGSADDWRRLHEFTSNVEAFIAETTGGDDGIRQSLTLLVGDGLDLSAIAEGSPFRDWLDAKGLGGRLKVTIR